MPEAQRILDMLKAIWWIPLFVLIRLMIPQFPWSRTMGTRTEFKSASAFASVVAVVLIGIFLYAEGWDIVKLGRTVPAWGFYVTILALATVAELLALWRLGQRANSLSVDILHAEAEPYEGVERERKQLLVNFFAILTASLFALGWLVVLARKTL